MSHRAIFLLVLPLLLLPFAACGGPRPRPWGSLLIAPGQPIPLALAASAAEMPSLAAQTAADAGAIGTVDGHPLSFPAIQVVCDGADPAAAAPSPEVLQTVAGVIGPMCSAACVYSEGVLYEQRLTMITPACTAAAVVQQGFPIAFRLAWDDNDQAVLAAHYAHDGLHVRRAALIGDGSVYASGLLTVFKDVFGNAGGAAVVSATLSSKGGNLTALARAIKASRADVVFVALDGPESASLLTGIRQALPGIPIMTGDTILAAGAQVCPAGEAAAGATPFPAVDNLYVATGLATRNGSWRSEIDSIAEQGCVGFEQELADAVQLYARAIGQVAKREPDGSLAIPRQALRDAIAREQISGQSGKIAFDAFGERLTGVGAELYRDEAGQSVAVKRLEH